MRFSKLLVLSALCLTATSGMAEIVNGERQHPVPASFVADYQTADTLYLYNVAAKQFYCGANDYNTRASVGEKGYKVAFIAAPDSLPGMFEFRDSVETQKEWKSTFATADGGAVWVDNSNETFRFWKLEKVGGAYRISNPVLENTFLGWNGSVGDTRLYLLAADAANAGIDWQFVTPEVYENYQATWAAMKDQFNKAAELKTVLDLAKQEGLDVSAWEQVYLNEAATVEELEAAIDAAKKAIAEAAAQKASVANPADMSTSITNPDFNSGNLSGWSGDAFGAYNGKDNAEHYSKNFKTYQVLGGMPKGVYAVGVKAFYRAGGIDGAYTEYKNSTEASRNAKLYAVSGNDTTMQAICSPYSAMITSLQGVGSESSHMDGDVTYYIPNNMVAAEHYMHVLNAYDNKVFIAVENDTLELGVWKTKTINTDWAIFDDFSLTFYGNQPEAYQFWLSEMTKGAAQYEEGVATQAYLDAYNQALQATANSKDEAVAAMKAIQAAADSISTNVALWSQLSALIEEAKTLTGSDSQIDPDAKSKLSDEVRKLERKIRGDKKLTNQELREEIEGLQKAMDEAKEHMSAGTDVTLYYLKNADYEKGSEGWEGGPVMGSGGGNTCAEAYGRANFDIYQVVAKAPKGVYTIEVQGFFRLARPQHEGGNPNAWSLYEEGKQIAPAFVYMNDNKTPLKCIYDEGKENGVLEEKEDTTITYIQSGIDSPDGVMQYPNTMAQAAQAFAYGMYKSTAYGAVANEGDQLRIGVKGSLDNASAGYGGANWAIWDNFKLKFYGTDVTYVEPMLQGKMDEVEQDAYLYLAMSKSAHEKLSAVVKAAQDALAEGTDGEKMFAALAEYLALQEEFLASIDLFNELELANTELATAIAESANQAVAEEANSLYSEITNCQSNWSIEDADAKEYIKKIKMMLNKLRLPADYDLADDENPVDLTALVQTPDFDKEGVNSIEGWTAEGYNFGNNDTQKGALALEFYNKTFDIYQDIEGLPEGTYEVFVDAFCRVGGIANDFQAYSENPDTTEAYLYGIANGAMHAVPVACIAKGALTDDPAKDGQGKNETDSVTYYIPNDMVSAAAFFEMDNKPYQNRLVIKVGADEKLRIGMKKEKNTDTGWVLLDSWKLIYHGKESALEESETGIQDIVNGPVMKVEFYTLDGRKANFTQKGIVIQKMTMNNGSVIVKKIHK